MAGEYTDAQIEEGIHRALQKQAIHAIPGLLALLAIQNPTRAEELRKTMLLGAEVAQETAPAPEHSPCCSAHGVNMTCGQYRRSHFVEVGTCH